MKRIRGADKPPQNHNPYTSPYFSYILMTNVIEMDKPVENANMNATPPLLKEVYMTA